MAISKTDFINYTRCPRYYNLEDIRKDKLSSKLTKEEYLKEKDNEYKKVLLDEMFDENEEDTTQKVDIQLEALMDYYTEVEIHAGDYVNKIFKGKTSFGSSIDEQMCFDYDLNGIRYMCYTDIVNESDDELNIIEVKATTSNKHLNLTVGKDKSPFWVLNNGIYYVNSDVDEKDFNKKLLKYYDRFDDLGKYVYDLSVQRYIIEGELKRNKSIKKVNYYLAILNHMYVYDGYHENDKRVYRTDENGNDIICLFYMNDISGYMQTIVDNDRKMLEKYIFNGTTDKCRVGKYCGLKKRGSCKFLDICFKDVPHLNASYNYKRFISFKDENGCTYDKYDLINNGMLKFDDVPYEWLTSKNHQIQRDCYDHDEVYVDKDKIKAGIDSLEYPIYHLDFESLPCPLPRFKNEKCYYQSVFEFSLHVERKPGECDKDKDNYVYLASTLKDEREEIIKALIENIDLSHGGTMLAQNVSFEKTRIKELAEMFPEYKNQLLKINEHSFDLLYLLDTNKAMYEGLGFDSEQAGTLNYYNKAQSGSYSIKKTLPLFSNLTYKTLEIKNGTEALVAYSKYDKMTKEELENARRNLIIYCKQDTWAMVEILNGLRELVK